MRMSGILTGRKFGRFAVAVLGVLSIFLLPSTLWSQSQNTSFKPDATLRGAARIDPSTLGMSLQVPLGAYPGRGGTGLPIAVSYSSKSLWRIQWEGDIPPQAPGIAAINLHESIFSERSVSGWTSSLIPPSLENDFGYYNSIGQDASETTYPILYMARIRITMPDGSVNELRKDDVSHSEPATSSFYYTGSYYSVDGSQMRFDYGGTSGHGTLYLNDGSRYIFEGGVSNYATQYIDRNGNVLTYNSSTKTWTDTMGRTFSPILPQFNPGKGDTTYAVPGVGNGSLTYTFRWRYLVDPDTGETILTNPDPDPNNRLAPAGSHDCRTRDLNGHLRPEPLSPRLFNSTSVAPICALPQSPHNPVVLSEIVLPNGQSYRFTYNQHGEIDKVVYPTGAYESFAYGKVQPMTYYKEPYKEANRGVYEHRVSPDGTVASEMIRQYGVEYTPGSEQYVTTTTAPDGTLIKRSLHTHWETYVPFGIEDARTGKSHEERVFAPASAGGAMLRRKLNEWIMDGPTPGGVSNATRDPRVIKQIGIAFEPGSANALASMSETIYDTNADPQYSAQLNPKQVKTYGYVVLDLTTAQTGTIAQISSLFNSSHLASVGETDYLYDSNYKARNITGLPTETRVLNPTNLSDILAKSQFVYDETAYFDNSYTTTNWEDPQSSLRGNVTTAKTWNKDTNTWIETHTMFDNFGNVRKIWDTSGDATRFVETEYSPTYNYAYPSKTKAPAPDPTGVHGTTEGSEITRTYDFNTGLMLSVTDANGQTATTEYDALLRPIRINPPAGGSVSEVVYNDTPGDIWIKRRQQIDDVNWAESTVYFDNLGRAFKSRTKDMQGDVMSQVKFDSFGRVERTSNPYRVDTNGNPTETVYWSKPRYDEQNRVVETYAPAPEGQTGQSLGTVQFGISTLPGLIGSYTVATDASGRKSRAISGIYGLMRVDEATGIGGTADQDLGALANPTQPTYYNYNIKGELTKITQGVQNRYFMYDSLGRLIRVRQPEQTPNANLATTGNPENNQWTAGYTYDVFGNVISMTDAKNTSITNEYDKAGRTTKRTYSDGTPQVEYFYDGKGLPSAPQFSKGSLTKVTSSISEDRFTRFDNHGRLLASEQLTDGQTYGFTYKYNRSGGLIEEIYPSGRIVRNFLDSDGGLNTVTTKTATDFNKRVASDFDYAASGSIKKMKLGNGLWETAQIDHLGQLTQIGLGTTATNNDLFKVNYEYGELNADGTTVDTVKNIGNIAKTTTTIPTTNFVQTFKYDAINRLTEAKETTGVATNWMQTFGYDRYGNRTQFAETIGGVATQNTNINHPTIDQANNRFTTGQGYVYDLNGNLIQDAEGRSFTFNGDDKQTEVRDAGNNIVGQYYYDGSGARVKKIVPSTGETTVFVYDAGGALAAEYSTVAPTNPTTSYLTTDHLGSPRVVTDATGQVTSRRDFMPFGEELGAGVGSRTQALKYSYLGSDKIRQRFTGYEKDDETGLDFAEARMYQNKHGRFTAPDPLLASASATNPQTFNRYVYTGNNPVNFTDPGGMKWCRIKGGTQMEFTGEGAPCQDGWDPVDKSYGTVSPDGDFSDVSENGPAGPGTIIYFNSNGTIRVADPTNSTDAAGIAAVTGTEVRSTMEEIVETTASIITDFGAGVIQGIAGSACMGQCDALNPRHTDTIPQRIGQGVGTAIDFGLGGVALDLGAKGSGAALATGQAEALAVTIPVAATGAVLMVGSTIYASQILEAGMPSHWTTPENIERMKQGKGPKDTDGKTIEVHHDGQKPDGELVPMTQKDHRGPGNHKKNHPSSGPSKLSPKIRKTDRERYWKNKAKELEQNK